MALAARTQDSVSAPSLSQIVAAAGPLHLLALALSACLVAAPIAAQAQVNPEIAQCSELKDEATILQAELCSAHIGCRFVMTVQRTCARAKGYLDRLGTAIGQGSRTLFGYRQEVTPDAIFTAAASDDARNIANQQLSAHPQALRRSQEVGARVRAAGSGDTLSGQAESGGSWVYYGQTKDGQAEGLGTRIFSNGEVQRGEFRQNSQHGTGDILYTAGARYLGDYVNSKRNGEGLFLQPSGAVITGTFRSDALAQGAKYRSDGTLSEQGRYENGEMSVGSKYDSAGGRSEVDLPRDRAIASAKEAENWGEPFECNDWIPDSAALLVQRDPRTGKEMCKSARSPAAHEIAARSFAERTRKAAEVEQRKRDETAQRNAAAQRQRDEAARAEQQRRAIASPPASGSAASDIARADRMSEQSCEALKQAVIATKIPDNASVIDSQETLMWITNTAVQMIDAGCPGGTPLQRSAERQQHLQTYAAAEQACNQVQSAGRRCLARNHYGPGAASKPVTPAAARSNTGPSYGPSYECPMHGAPPDVIQSYNPVNGKILCAKILDPALRSSVQPSAPGSGSSGASFRYGSGVAR